MCPEALQGSWRIPYVAVPIVRMTGRPAIIKRRQALAVAKAALRATFSHKGRREELPIEKPRR
jgi:hypothetical protein